MPVFPELVVTSRLRLVRWDVARHTPALIALNADPRTVEFLNAGTPYTSAESLRQSERFAAHWSTYGFGLWAMEPLDPAEGLMIGFTGFAHPRWFPAVAHEVEIGWRLHPAAWGNGYATEAAHAAIAAATKLPIDHLIAIIDPANTRSIAVATRLGMTPSRTVPHPQTKGTVTIFSLPVPT